MLIAAVCDPLDVNLVAAFLGDQVHPHAAELVLGALRIGAVDEFLDRCFLRLGDAADAELSGAAPHQMLTRLEPVDHRVAVLGIGTMGDRPGVAAGNHHAGDQCGPTLDGSRARQDLDLLLGEHRFPDRVLDVHDR